MKNIKKDMEIEYTILGTPAAVAKAQLVFETITGRPVYEETNAKKPYFSFTLNYGDDKIEAAMMHVCHLLKCDVHYVSSDFRRNIHRKHGSHYKTLKYVVDDGCGDVDYLPTVAKVKEWFSLTDYFPRKVVQTLKTPEEIVKFIKHNKDMFSYPVGKVSVYEIEAE